MWNWNVNCECEYRGVDCGCSVVMRVARFFQLLYNSSHRRRAAGKILKVAAVEARKAYFDLN